MSTISEYSDDYLPCRAGQHAWPAFGESNTEDIPSRGKRYPNSRSVWRVPQECLHGCGTRTIVIVFRLTGETMRIMLHEPDYLTKGGTIRKTRFRVEAMERLGERSSRSRARKAS